MVMKRLKAHFLMGKLPEFGSWLIFSRENRPNLAHFLLSHSLLSQNELKTAETLDITSDAEKQYISLIASLIKEESSVSENSTSPDSNYEGLRLEKDGPATFIFLNRPKKKNAITWEMYEAWVQALQDCAKDDTCKVVAICGTGDFFCSGNDLSNFTREGDLENLLKRAKDILQRFVAAFIDFPKPLIGLVNGPAIGVSVTTLALYDIVLASDKATFHTPLPQLGQVPEGCSSFTFPRIMGYSNASSMLLFNKKISAQQAQDFGLVTQVIPSSSFEAEAKEFVKSVSKQPPIATHHSKQLLRAGEREILHKNVVDDYNDERITNITACAGSVACWSDSDPKPFDVKQFPETLHETLFNKAAYYIGIKNYRAALNQLEKAEVLLRENLENDSEITKEEVEEELASITTQKAFVMQMLNDSVAATNLYHHVIRQSLVTDQALLAVASNNLICLNGKSHLIDSRKRIKFITSLLGDSQLRSKLFKAQQSGLDLTYALFLWQTGQFDACSKRIAACYDEMKESECLNRFDLLRASLLIQDDKLDDGLKLIRSVSERKLAKSIFSSEDSSLIAPLVALQTDLLPQNLLRVSVLGSSETPKDNKVLKDKKKKSVIQKPELLIKASTVELSEKLELVTKSKSIINSPALLALRLTIMASDKNCKEKLVGAINEAIQYHDEHKSEFRAAVMAYCGEQLYQASNEQESCAIYEKLLFLLEKGKLDDRELKILLEEVGGSAPDDTGDKGKIVYQTILAKLIASYSHFDRHKAESLSQQLELGDDLTEQEVDALETAFLFGAKYVKRLNRHAEKMANVLAEAATAKIEKAFEKKKKAKKRKTILPKNAIPGVMPDPERWIPKRERTSNRGASGGKKGARKNVAQLRGPQGQTSGAANWDVNVRKFANETTTTTTAPQKSMSAAAKTQQRKGRRGRR
ncbi:Signal recognition particle core component [Cichlidogyrus casuarinus]|uniref:Signal recognition particle core component n=1 Tax=Cichlidogyrus casuarinus TaxID=1844966 RepID=A0ABD2QBD9_9PLAT